MRKAFMALTIGAPALCLAACATSDPPAPAEHAGHAAAPAPGGVIRYGDSFASMSQQYTPRAGAAVATGASAWVAPSPPPAFVASAPLPPADPPAPPPAAVANRQPSAPVAEVVRPEAAAPEPSATPARDPAVRTAGLALFNANSCAACHAFVDAGASGTVGPSLDGRLAVRAIVNAVTEGRGAMPSFRGAMSDAEILTLANYLAQYSR